jgi:hypothetical protein
MVHIYNPSIQEAEAKGWTEKRSKGLGVVT